MPGDKNGILSVNVQLPITVYGLSFMCGLAASELTGLFLQ